MCTYVLTLFWLDFDPFHFETSFANSKKAHFKAHAHTIYAHTLTSCVCFAKLQFVPFVALYFAVYCRGAAAIFVVFDVCHRDTF